MSRANSVSHRSGQPDGLSGAPAAASPIVSGPALKGTADARLARWVASQLRTPPPKAKSLMVTVWGDSIAPHGGAVWLSALIELLAPFGISERLTRTSVYRLTRDGWLSVSSHGRRSRYRLTAEGGRRFEDAHRRIYSPPVHAWDGTWELVIAPPGHLSPGQRAVLRRELGWQGFAEMTPHLLLRPAYREQSAAGPLLRTMALEQRVALARTRDHEPAPGSRQSGLGSRAHRLWDLRSVAAQYRAFERRFRPLVALLSTAAGHPLRAEQCFVVRTLLIHAFRRVTLHDPQLPRELLPSSWPGDAAYDLCATLYRLTQAGAEAHLASVLGKHDGGEHPTLPYFHARFGGLEPSGPPSPARRPSGNARR